MDRPRAPIPIASLYGSAALLGSVVCWAIVPVLLRHLTGSIDAWTANGIRYPLSALLYWPILWHAHQRGRLNRSVAVRCLAPAALALSAQVFWALAPYYLAANAIGFFVRFTLVWSVLGAVVLFRDERELLRRPRFYIGMGLCVFGFVALSMSARFSSEDVSPTGIVIMFFFSLFFGLYAVAVRLCLRGINSLIGFGMVAQYVSIGTVTAMLVWGAPSIIINLPAQAWAALVVSSVLGIAMGHFFLYAAIKRVGAAITSGVQSVTPFLTVGFAYLFLGESMTASKWLAGTIMVVGAAVLLSVERVVAKEG
jgi:drug/metabolite transporter (DMT)-like permease